MIQNATKVKVADNSGARQLRCIRVWRGYQRRYASVGDLITASVIQATPRGVVKKGDLVTAVIVRTVKEIRRPNGTYVRFSDNAAVIIDREAKNKLPQGTSIVGPVARELRSMGFQKIVSLAPEVL